MRVRNGGDPDVQGGGIRDVVDEYRTPSQNGCVVTDYLKQWMY